MCVCPAVTVKGSAATTDRSSFAVRTNVSTANPKLGSKVASSRASRAGRLPEPEKTTLPLLM